MSINTPEHRHGEFSPRLGGGAAIGLHRMFGPGVFPTHVGVERLGSPAHQVTAALSPRCGGEAAWIS